MRALSIVIVLAGATPARAEPVQFCGQTVDDKTTTIQCKDHKVSDLSPLAGATALEKLDVRMTAVADLKPLAGLTKLEHLDIRGTKVTSLAPLAKVTSLKRLTIEALAVTDLKPLSGLPLEELHMSMAKATDLAPLAKIATLTELDLSDSAVTNIKPLGKLAHLDQVDLRRSKVSKADAQWLGKIAQMVYWGDQTFKK
jgi:internalin A